MSFKPFVFLLCLASVPIVVIAEPTPSVEALWEIVQAQQKTIEQLQRQLQATQTSVESTEKSLAETQIKHSELDGKLEATADMLESGSSESVSWADKTSLGGYGELHYNNLEDDSIVSDADVDDLNRVDFHRFVLFLGHEFTHSIRFYSELEVEHAIAGEGQPGEVELEQAWIEIDANDFHRFRAGLDILPIGLVSYTHEPNTFYGVERNRVEAEIIPSTWWEAGAGFIGQIAPGWNYDILVHSGLSIPTSGSSAFRPRSGRTKIGNADDTDYAITGRIRYTRINGLEVALSGQYQADYTGTADAVDVDAFLIQAHIDWKHASGFGLRAFYASWFFDDDPAAGLDAGIVGADDLDGFYIEPAYRFNISRLLTGELGVFFRYAQWDERNRLAGMHRFERFEGFNVGINYWPTAQVVFKVDGQWESADGPVDQTLDGFNLGLGYQF